MPHLCCSLGLLLLHLLQVEVKLLALQNVAIAASALTRAAGDAGIQTTSGKLVCKVLVQLLVCAEAILHLALHVVGALQTAQHAAAQCSVASSGMTMTIKDNHTNHSACSHQR